MWTIRRISDESDGVFTISPAPPAIIFPKLFTSSASIQAGSSLLINGNEFSQSSSVKVKIYGPPGFEPLNVPSTSNSNGEITYTFVTTVNYPLGIYSVYAVDELTNKIIRQRTLY